jgi:RimJ/RimL family protein N-acetyltransferase
VGYCEISGVELDRLGRYFAHAALDLVLRAAIAGNSPLQVLVDSPLAPRTALAWDGRFCIYLAGKVPTQAGGDLLEEFLLRIACEAKTRGIGVFRVHLGHPAWERAVADRLPAMRPRQQLLYRRRSRQPAPSLDLPIGFHLRPIDRMLLEATYLANYERLIDEIRGSWPTIERFLERGFGIAITHDDALVSWCTAEYVSEGQCGIGIETISSFQNQGLATIAGSAFVAACDARQVVAHWESWKDNYPSMRVAEKLGFEATCEYQVYYGRIGLPARDTNALG